MKFLALKLIRFYQKYLSFDSGFFKRLFLTDQVCRFTPTCSEYTYQAIEKYGIIFGSWKALGRIIRCNPWNRGGIDPLKQIRSTKSEIRNKISEIQNSNV